MPSRRYHKKSRFGCNECKVRKVKCDEERPSCVSCTRTGVACLYLIERRPSSSASPSHRTLPKSVAAAKTAAGAEVFATPSPSPHSQPCTSIFQPDFNLVDLALMNHFTAVTSLSLFSGEQQRKIWQTELPSQARSNALLMHGLLAVAAVHLTRSSVGPQERSLYWTRALHHHGLGLQLFNGQISQLSPENSDVLFAFAVMLVIWVYASPAADGDALRLDDILGKLDIVRGCRTVFKLHRESILGRPIGKFVDFHQTLGPPMPSSPAHEAFMYLWAIAIDSIHAKAIDQLHLSLQKYVEEDYNSKTATAWPALVGDAFWARCKCHEPVAVLILAHYAILLRCYEDRLWWMTDWSEKIIQVAGDALTGSQKASVDWDVCVARIRVEGFELASREILGAYRNN